MTNVARTMITHPPCKIQHLEDATCPSCEQPLMVQWRHWHGSPKQPCLVCQTADCVGPSNYGPIAVDLWQAWIEYQADIAEANVAWARRLEAEYSLAKGTCACGCGQRTPVYGETCTKKGQIKGRPTRFLPGHQARVSTSGKRPTPRPTPSFMTDDGGNWIVLISLTRGYTATIDAEDFELIARHRWFAQTTKKGSVYAATWIGRKFLYLHQLLCPSESGCEVDHRDGNGLNNRRGNLRSSSRSQNGHNTPKRSTNKSGYKGVSWSKKENKWVVQISFEGKTCRVGCFSDKTRAAAAYDAAATRLAGEYARLNGGSQ